MTYIKGSISEELDNEFRKEVAKRFGMRKGALSKALEEAIRQWIENGRNINSAQEKSSHENLKERLMHDHPNKFIITRNNKVLEIADSVIEATKQARKNYPEIEEFVIIHTVPKKFQRRQLGWRIRRIKQ